MFSSIENQICEKIQNSIRKNFNIEIEKIVVERPPKVSIGDFAVPIAFELAKKLKATLGSKHNPRQLATMISAEIDLPMMDRIEVAGAGYINFFVKRSESLLEYFSDHVFVIEGVVGGKLIVEHTSINPNKAAHIGHLRNAVLGDTLVRMFKACGETVEIHNYIDNTGVQVADVVVGFLHLEKKSLEEIKSISDRFDYYCWNLYSRVGQFYAENKDRLKLRAEVLHELEEGSGESTQIAEYVSTKILRCHLDTMLRVGIYYDALPRESEVLNLHFWDEAFEQLKAVQAVVYESEGRNKGCWVMPSEYSLQNEDEEHDINKILVRSNGTVNYTGKDIAYHLWKLGHLKKNLPFKPFYKYPDGHVAWITYNSKKEEIEYPATTTPFGNGDAFFNVIDVGQSYAQEYVKKGVLAVMAKESEQAYFKVNRSAHLNYEKVALSPASCEELGFELSDEDRQRSFVNMSGRKGLGVKADELLDLLEEKALIRVKEHQPILCTSEQRKIASIIAVGAVRYFLLKYTRNSVIAFDFKEALAAEGETGVYLQYSIVRIESIYERLLHNGISVDISFENLEKEKIKLGSFLTGEEGDEYWTVILLALRSQETLRQAVELIEPAQIARYGFQLAQAFNTFYNRHNILHEQDPIKQNFFILITKLVNLRLRMILKIMGIDVPTCM